MRKLWLLLLVPIVLVGCGGDDDVDKPDDHPTHVHNDASWGKVGEYVEVTDVTVNGVRCVVATQGGFDGGAGISCDWESAVRGR